MTKILITEFINESSLNNLKKNFDVHYDEKLWSQTEKLIKSILSKTKFALFRLSQK